MTTARHEIAADVFNSVLLAHDAAMRAAQYYDAGTADEEHHAALVEATIGLIGTAVTMLAEIVGLRVATKGRLAHSDASVRSTIVSEVVPALSPGYAAERAARILLDRYGS